MNNDLISRKSAHNMVRKLTEYVWQNPQLTEYRITIDYDDVQFGLDKIPAADAVEVKHGRWVFDEYTKRIRCSECKAYKLYDIYMPI